MNPYVGQYVCRYVACRLQKEPPMLSAGLLHPLTPPDAHFERVAIDLLGPFPTSVDGNRWMIVAIDYFTRYVETSALSSDAAPIVSYFFLGSIPLRQGAPREFVSDMGKTFPSTPVEIVLQLYHTIHRPTTAYHVQTNSMVEKFNVTLANVLSLYVYSDDTNWDTVLPHIIFPYNTPCQRPTGRSSYFLFHGRQPLLLMDSMLHHAPPELVDNFSRSVVDNAEAAPQLARMCTVDCQFQQQQRYDASHSTVD